MSAEVSSTELGRVVDAMTMLLVRVDTLSSRGTVSPDALRRFEESIKVLREMEQAMHAVIAQKLVVPDFETKLAELSEVVAFLNEYLDDCEKRTS